MQVGMKVRVLIYMLNGSLGRANEPHFQCAPRLRQDDILMTELMFSDTVRLHHGNHCLTLKVAERISEFNDAGIMTRIFETTTNEDLRQPWIEELLKKHNLAILP